VASHTAPIDWNALERCKFHTLEATHVNRGHSGTTWTYTRPERRTATGGAEVMIDDMLVELVGGHALFGRFDAELGAWNEPKEIPFATAMRTVALFDFRELTLDFKRNPTAMAAS
jgi:hypothetical protein